MTIMWDELKLIFCFKFFFAGQQEHVFNKPDFFKHTTQKCLNSIFPDLPANSSFDFRVSLVVGLI